MILTPGKRHLAVKTIKQNPSKAHITIKRIWCDFTAGLQAKVTSTKCQTSLNQSDWLVWTLCWMRKGSGGADEGQHELCCGHISKSRSRPVREVIGGEVEDKGRAGCRWEIEVWKVKIITILEKPRQQTIGAQVYKDLSEQDVRLVHNVYSIDKHV